MENINNQFDNTNYLSKQLIAYIGNKRRLLPLIKKAIIHCNDDITSDCKFVDFFSGSGSVAKLAKSMNFHVVANDWESYSNVLNEAFLVTNSSDLNNLFVEHGGIEEVLKLLNNLEAPSSKGIYISEYYCPEDTLNPDPKNERMFYTKENGNRIDAIREWIEINYPGKQKNKIKKIEKNLLLGLLIYEAATHSNTSGVFKAYHNGFGGRGRDALSRILSDIELEYPELIDGKAEVSNMDANALAEKLAKNEKVEIAYLDPPYNQHQYGSNYHLLNTIALNDKPKIKKEIIIGGKKVEKGGIRKDWIKTKSDYCYKSSAEESFSELISKINAKNILISYSTEGIIPFTKMLQILSRKGKLDIVLSEYTRYRGGKQALTSTLKNVEFVLIVNTEKKNSKEDTNRILQILGQKKMEIFLKRSVSPGVFIKNGFEVNGFSSINEDLEFTKSFSNKLKISAKVADFKRIISCKFFRDEKEILPGEMSDTEFNTSLSLLESLTNVTKEEELSVTINWIMYLYEKGHGDKILNALPELPYLLKKFNDKKAYKLSLFYIIKILKTIHLIKMQDSLFSEDKKFNSFLLKLNRIIQLKLSIPVNSIQEQETINNLKVQIHNWCHTISLKQ